MEKLPAKILVVDDEKDIVEFISYNLIQQNYIVAKAYDGEEAIKVAKTFNPDLILLDIMMNKKDGKETLKILRTLPDFEKVIVIFLTALSDEQSEVQGLQLGADDYISKPIKPALLNSRISAALRRLKSDENFEEKIILGDLEINKTQFAVKYQDKEITLAKKEFELLMLLASKPGRVFLRQEILQRVWGTEVIVGDRTIDVHIRKIRQKLGIDLITTVKGVGYKFEMA